MPIPPRPIPTPAPRRATMTNATKPGSSLPRRGLHFMDHADMFDLPLPSSAPVKGLSGVSVVAAKPEVKVKEPRKTVVNVSDLITEGMGKREKRTTTATSLGFDFVQNPTVLALPDDPATDTQLGRTHTPTPTTPALVPSQANEQEEDDDDWEHINGAQAHQDEDDMILLGELELEDAAAGAGIKDTQTHGKAGIKSYAAVVGAATAAGQVKA